DANTNTLVKTTTTDINGNYLFDKLLPGDYYARFDLPTGYNFTTPNVGNNDTKDSDVDNSNGPRTTATTNLSLGENDRTWDVGLYRCSMIGGRVFFDDDKDGIFDPNENGINGLKVYLVDANTGVVVTSLFTAVNPATPSDDGYYKFACIKPGMYYVQFERPGFLAASEPFKGGNADKDSDIGHENGVNTTRKITLLSGDMILNIGAGFQIKATMGDFVWLDANFNGIQDGGEQPVSGVKVNAYNMSGSMVSESTTGYDGHYMLDGIAQGDYYVKFIPPANFDFTAAHKGTDPVDNDVDGTNGYGTTRVYRINAGDALPTIDAGLVNSVLAIEWLNFTGTYNGSFTELNWETGVELNNDHFEIERRHESEKGFQVIGKEMASANGANSQHLYNHDDLDVNLGGIYYYRIKQLDKDGQYTYSKVISIKVNRKPVFNVSIYPNPVDDLLKVEITVGEETELEVRVFDKSGKNVLTNPFGGFKKVGKYSELLNTSILAAGQYNLQIVTNSGIVNKQFTVLR
ncbi:MAG: SdrD B-like domain-containing protein, partial [Saprospiraceae bacterium]